MACKIHPLSSFISSSSSSKKASFTVWMKSLIMHGKGCTVYNEKGHIVYRVDNYDKKCSNEVYLMDLKGKVLFTILRTKIYLFRQWICYNSDGLKLKSQKPFFQVRKIFGGDLTCQVTLQSNNGQASCYKLERLAGKSEFKIMNNEGVLIAEVRRKQISSGILLGDDVLTLIIEAHVDHSLIIALVTLYGLMHHKL